MCPLADWWTLGEKRDVTVLVDIGKGLASVDKIMTSLLRGLLLTHTKLPNRTAAGRAPILARSVLTKPLFKRNPKNVAHFGHHLGIWPGPISEPSIHTGSGYVTLSGKHFNG